MQSNSTVSMPPGKPAKPYPEFPLFAHATNRWAKKIRGKLHYFGPWNDPEGSLQRYLDRKDELHSGRTPRQDLGEVTVKDLVNAFLNHKKGLLESGELRHSTWRDYKSTCDYLVDELGKRRLVVDVQQDDFARLRRMMAKRWGLHRLNKVIQYTRSVFIFGHESGLLDRAKQFGPAFERPSKQQFRIAKAKLPPKLFTAKEIKDMIDAATQPLKAMILLGINCGFGNADCGTLPKSAVDLKNGWIDFPRPKTGIGRRCPLWPETVAALRKWLKVRPAAASDELDALVFVTSKGSSWFKDSSDNPVSKEMRKLLSKLKINGERNFYTLRHTHRTIADKGRDRSAADYIMGHANETMADNYVHQIDDDRLRVLVGIIRSWLLDAKREGRKSEAAELQC